ncbi:MAG: exodeoxyribonuclease III [Deltaproteobacteria bacterium]|jgi:exodeoxyribonuclease-3|nr:exodeoxyribonuclease III [Deltaproteobacteria bacterium]
MKLYSWNVNGLRAVAAKPTFWPWFKTAQADLFAFQETKARPEQLDPSLSAPAGYCPYFSWPTEKKGYSGVAVYSLTEPIQVTKELPEERFAREGRLLHLEMEKFHFLNIYFPNGQKDEDRLDFKMGFYESFLSYSQFLRKSKPVVICGDFNTAHREIDLAHPDLCREISGFLDHERAFLSLMIRKGYIDTFRHINGDLEGQYSWWSYRAGDRIRNDGWRIDYFFVSQELEKNLTRAWLEPHVTGSDHCPIGIELSF